jgi:subtilase family serine protease
MRKYPARLHVEPLEARDLMSVAYTPAQIRHAYSFDQVPLDGSGQTIAIVDAYDDPNLVGDLITFDRTFGLPDPPSLTKVNEFGGTDLPQADAGWSGEISLDVEWSHAIAPGANILLVEANSASLLDLFTAVDYARNQPGVVTVSMSFGGGEGSFEPFVDSILTTPAGHIGGSGLPGGVTFVASTGDAGAPGGYPAYSPNVLAVGGTSLYLDDWGNYLGEVGWSGSGGGISQVEPEPAYQYSVQSTGARTIPDVSYDADPSTGYYIFNTAAGGWEAIGGTSAGAPQWAALIALADQARALYLGAGSLDGATQTLPAIYSPVMSGDFNDVTFGSNGYDAGPGYDLVTGLGTPYAPFVVYDLALAGFESPAASPAIRSAARTTPADDTASLLASSQLENPQLSKSAVETIFTETGTPVATIPEADHAPVPTILVDQATLELVSKTGPAPVGHPRAVSTGLPHFALGQDSLRLAGIETGIASQDL